MSTRDLSVTLDLTDKQWTALASEAGRVCYDPSPGRLAAAILERLGVSLASPKGAARKTASDALVLLGLAHVEEHGAGPADFAGKLAALRESAGLSLADLGDAAGLSRQRVHQLEAGTHRPSWAEVQALAVALGVSTEAFRDPE